MSRGTQHRSLQGDFNRLNGRFGRYRYVMVDQDAQYRTEYRMNGWQLASMLLYVHSS